MKDFITIHVTVSFYLILRDTIWINVLKPLARDGPHPVFPTVQG